MIITGLLYETKLFGFFFYKIAKMVMCCSLKGEVLIETPASLVDGLVREVIQYSCV